MAASFGAIGFELVAVTGITLVLIATPAASAPSSVSGAGITLTSQSVGLPSSDGMFDGAGADAINNTCLACHSAGMVLNQPTMSRAAWQAEVTKMHTTFKAPVDQDAVPAIVDYLARIKGSGEGTHPAAGRDE